VQFDLSKRQTQSLFVFILALSIALQWYGHACGLIKTSDSYQYLSAAQSFKTNGNFLSPDGSYYTYWPPLFPVILSVFDSPESALIWIHVVAKVSIGLLIYFIANEFLEKNIFKVLFFVATLCSVQITMISVFVWSELIFLLLLLLTVYCALKMKASQLHFIGLLVFSFLMCLQRNAGAFFIPAIGLWIVLDTTSKNEERIVRSTAVCISGLAGLFLWNIYISYFIPSNFYFYRHEFFVDYALNFSTLSTLLIKFFIPRSEIFATFLGLVLLLAVVVLTVKGNFHNRHVQLVGLLILFYWMGLMSMARLDIYETDRYLSVILHFVYLLFFFLIEIGFKRVNAARQLAMVVVLLLWMIYPVSRAIKNTHIWNEKSCSAYPAK
jgi:hypothetical protein